MNKIWGIVVAALVVASLTTIVAFTVVADDDDRGARSFRARLTGYEETPNTLSSPGSGTLRLRISSDGQSATYALTYSGLADVRQAHIHFGARGLSGGISVWLCQTAANPGPAGTPDCLASAGRVTGVITPESVVGPAGQGIAPGEWDEFVAALRAGFTYANVHTAAFGGGEIRGQISPSG